MLAHTHIRSKVDKHQRISHMLNKMLDNEDNYWLQNHKAIKPLHIKTRKQNMLKYKVQI